MAENLVVNGVTYNGVDSIAMKNDAGETVLYIAPHTSEYPQMNEAVLAFVEEVTYNPSDYSTSQIANYAGQSTDYEKSKPLGVTVNVPEGKLVVADAYSGIATEETVPEGYTTIYNLTPGENGANYVVVSGNEIKQNGYLIPTGQLRMINCETVNVRDLGGWDCDGGTVKYGKLFRGGEFKTADADIFLKQLGIRHELNLRGTEEAEQYYNTYLTDSDILLRNVIRSTCPEQYVWYTIADTYADAWREILRCVFDCAKYSEPLFFHCSAGADRTGTVACIIEAILGMSQSDIDKDYELTCFYSGVASDSAARRRNEGEWRGLINQINALAVGSTFRDKVINWVVSLGFTIDEINAFRKAMINGTPEDIILTPETETIPITWLNGKTCTYAVGSPCNVSDSASYIISEKIAVEYGKTYSCEWDSPSNTASFYFIGIDDDNNVTEQIKFAPAKAGTVTAEWTVTVPATTKLRLRGYATGNMTFTEMTVS